MESQYIVNIEARIKTVRQLAEVRKDVAHWVQEQYKYVEANQYLIGFEVLDHASNIDAIQVVDCLPHDANSSHYSLENAHLAVHTYILYHVPDTDIADELLFSVEDNEGPELVNLTSYQLPNVVFEDIWQSLHFETTIREELLHELTQTILMEREKGFDPSLHDWTGLVLLHGPPGSGKTSLCKALAQKLAIRLTDVYRSFFLIEMNANDLHSKWFGESGKNIAKIFGKIYTMARGSDDFICILIDEVETVAGSRQQSANNGEIGDARRATNQLLTALDKLRFHPNVLVFCTSNLMTTLDEAFLSRVDIAEFVGNATPAAAYEILRSCLNDLIWKGQIHLTEAIDEEDEHVEGEDTMEAIDKIHGYKPKDPFPKHKIASLQQCIAPHSPASKLLTISNDCAGFSGRLLRRLPRRAISRYTTGRPQSAIDVLKALRLIVDKHTSLNCGLTKGEEDQVLSG